MDRGTAPCRAGPLLEVSGLNVAFATEDGEVRAVRDVDLTVAAGEVVGVVGESGSGKTQLFLAAMGLLAANGRASGSVRLGGEEILGLPARRLNRIRGARVAMVFQNPMTSLNPYLRVSTQMTEVLRLHRGLSARDARRRAAEMLDLVRIPDAARRLDAYPHELSGGMRQRVMIATALLCRPELLIADEPTTALDVTVQADILDLLAEARWEFGTAIVLITHDLGVVAGLADRVVVTYAGRIVERGPVRDLFHDPRHPYTRALLGCVPRLDADVPDELPAIPGQPPASGDPARGCAFLGRCAEAGDRCRREEPGLRGLDGRDPAARASACHRDTAAGGGP
jgi:oligopeptide transport system ATP-binding protein